MANEELETLKEEAKSLGIEFNSNIGMNKLQEKVDAYYAAESAANSGGMSPIVEDKPKVTTKTVGVEEEDPKMAHKRMVAAMKQHGKRTRAVKVTMVDKRENSEVTSYYVHNGDNGLHIPLDTPIELEERFITVLKEVQQPLHVKDTNGNQTVKMVPKFVIETV